MVDRNRHDEEGSAPEGWQPSSLDPIDQALLELIAQADSPSIPVPSHFDSMRREIRDTLFAEGLLAVRRSPAAEPGFSEWLRLMLFGGKLGGQLVRLGAVAGVGLFIGVTMPRGSDVAYERPASTLTARTDSPATVTAPSSDMGVPFTSHLTPTPTPMFLSQEGLPLGGTIVRSVADEEDAGWDRTSPAARPWVQGLGYDVGMRPVAATSPGASAPQPSTLSPDFASQAMDQLLILKFHSMTNRDERALEEVRRLENVFSQMVDQTAGKPDNKTIALHRYRQAEAALNAGRFYDAQMLFDQVAAMAPGSFLAFVATYQIGRLAFERTHDYRTALDAYLQCLKEFPATYATRQARDLIERRVEMLRATATDDWRDMRLWHQAENAPAINTALDSLMQLVTRATHEPLAAEAATRLAELLTADPRARTLDATAALAAIRARADSANDGTAEARLRLASAELLFQRLGRVDLAADDYRRVFQLTADPELRQVASTRLRLLQFSSDADTAASPAWTLRD